MSTEVKDLLENKLKPFLEQLPETEIKRKTLLEIARFPHREFVNSSFLAFYLDPEEEHGFGPLFLNALLDAYQDKAKDQENPSEIIDPLNDKIMVEQESDDIDLLVSGFDEGPYVEEGYVEDGYVEKKGGKSWAVIIENKVESSLHNPLDSYWERVDHVDQKFGIVLSLWPIGNEIDPEAPFYNITHQELNGKVKERLSEAFDGADDRHLLFLKEYFATLEKLATMEENWEKTAEKLRLFHQNKELIKELKQEDQKLLQEVHGLLEKVFQDEDIGLRVKEGQGDKYPTKHFKDPDVTQGFRVYINAGKLRYENELEGTLELAGPKNTEFGKKTKELLNDSLGNEPFPKGVKWGKRGQDRSHVQQLIGFNLELPDREREGISLEEAIKRTFKSAILEYPSPQENLFKLTKEAYIKASEGAQ